MKSKKPEPFNPKSKKSLLQIAIENNPCTPCRLYGLPMCPGHAASGGGSLDQGGTSGNSSVDLSPDKVAVGTITAELADSKNWAISQWAPVLAYIQPMSLLAIKIDLLKGVLTFKAATALDPSEKAVLQAFFAQLKEELKAFELYLERQGIILGKVQLEEKENKLQLKFSDPTQLASFVAFLITKNLLPTKKTTYKLDHPTALTSEKTEASKPFSPTPFSLKPKPYGVKNS